MKKIKRLPEPDSFFKGRKKIKFYQNLRDDSGKIRDRWKLKTYRDDLRKRLLEMSSNECAYCGKRISESDMDIEHFFPKEKFPYLSYCFENYLPSCKNCNQNIKKGFYPKSLEDWKDRLSEEILIGQNENLILYERDKILNETADRIIEPSFDNIEEHLEFKPEASSYIAKTEIGKRTKKMFFEHREVKEYLKKLSNKIFNSMDNQKIKNKEDIMDWAKLYGYAFYFEQFYEYWSDFFEIRENDL